MNEIVKVTTEGNQQTVSARELHKALEVSRRFGDWWNDIDKSLNLLSNKHVTQTCHAINNRSFKDFAVII